ncbi:MAG TPA: hypothetical protein VGB67_08520 [Fibrella sp.]
MTRAMIRFAILSLLAMLALVITHPAQSHANAPTTRTLTVSTPTVAKGHTEPLMARMVDCESYDIQPCWTYDEGRYVMVLSYSPYRVVKLSVCKVEDGGPALPCIWRKDNRVPKGEPVTRNVFTKA